MAKSDSDVMCVYWHLSSIARREQEEGGDDDDIVKDVWAEVESEKVSSHFIRNEKWLNLIVVYVCVCVCWHMSLIVRSEQEESDKGWTEDSVEPPICAEKFTFFRVAVQS